MRAKILGFFKRIWGEQPSAWRVLVPGLILTAILLVLPTGYEGAQIYQGTDKVRATILETDNSTIISTGLIQNGEQR